jgi:hypothetical protein
LANCLWSTTKWDSLLGLKLLLWNISDWRIHIYSLKLFVIDAFSENSHVNIT